MKKTFPLFAILLALVVLPAGSAFASLADLAAEPSPDDIMLRKPTAKPASVKPIEAPKPVAAPEATGRARAPREPNEEAKPVAVAKQVEAPKPVAKPVEAPKPVAKPVEAPKPVTKPVEAPKPVAKPVEAPKPVAKPAEAPTPTVPAPKPVVKVEKSGTPADRPAEKAKPAKKAKKLTGRAAVITADRTDYDRKEGVILFDRHVSVNDEQYQMHADRLFVFLDGTNDLKRLVALGNVALTNDTKSAGGTKAVYTKALSRIVLYGTEESPAWLRDVDKRRGDSSEVRGLRITYWIDSGLATVEKTTITVPGLKGSNNPKEILGGVRGKDAKKEDK